jgi:hypothetical protein
LVSSTGVLAASLRAGPAVEYKQVAPPPPPLYGVGLYGAIDMGANVYQNRGDDRTFTDDNPNSPFFGSTLDVDPKNDVGFFGGIKLGYVFGTGWIRPTLEGDFFYNGFRGGADFTLNEAFTPCAGCPTFLSTHQRDVTTRIKYWRVPGELHPAIRAWERKVPAVCRRGCRRLLCRICGH